MSQPLHAFSADVRISVIGVGDAGGSAVKCIADDSLGDVDFICVNSDAQALKCTDVWTPVEIGRNLPHRTFAGPSIEMIRSAVNEDRDQIQKLIDGVDMVFVVAGLGGVTGTGATPVVGRLARDSGALTIALVTTPFAMEGVKRTATANEGLDELAKQVDLLISIPNEGLLKTLKPNVTLRDAYRYADQFITNIVHGIVHLITRRGMITVDSKR